jgi:hypothetical protein
MVQATVWGAISILTFGIGWTLYFLGAPPSLESILISLTDAKSFPLQFWLITLVIFVAVFITVRNMQKHSKKRRSRW